MPRTTSTAFRRLSAVSVFCAITPWLMPSAVAKEDVSLKTKIVRFAFPKTSIGSLSLITSEHLDTGETSWPDKVAAVGDITLTVKADENVMLTPTPATLMNLKSLDSPNRKQIDGIRVKYVASDESHHSTNLILDQLATMKDLKYLLINRTDASDAGFKNFPRMERLVRLDVSSTEVTGSFLSSWDIFPKLKTLEMSHCPINSEHLKNLRNIPQLKELDLRSSRLPSVATIYISTCAELERLSLAENENIRNESLPPLQHLCKLKELDLNDTGVTVTGLTSLKTLPLSRLTLSHRFFKSKKELQKIFPRCTLIFARDKELVSPDVQQIFAPLK